MNIEQAHAYFTECNLATLEHMATIKRTAKSDISRQRNICLQMLKWIDGDQAAVHAQHCGRVLKALADAAGEPEGMNGVLDRRILECQALQVSKK